VTAFQRHFGLTPDGIAGRLTIERLDAELAARSRRTLLRLDRLVDRLEEQYDDDKLRAQIAREFEDQLRQLRNPNLAGFAMAAPAIILLVIIFFAVLLWLSMPQTQKALREAMKATIDFAKGRGEVLQKDIDWVKGQVNDFIDQARDIRTECEKQTEKSDPRKYADCIRRLNTPRKVAFEKLQRVLKQVSQVIYDSLGRGRLRIPAADAIRQMRAALHEYIDALNDFLRCLGCDELPYPDIFGD
jgi:hypothetical protein